MDQNGVQDVPKSRFFVFQKKVLPFSGDAMPGFWRERMSQNRGFSFPEKRFWRFRDMTQNGRCLFFWVCNKIKYMFMIENSMATRKRHSATTAKKSYTRMRQYWNRVHKRIKGTKCVMQTTKKYLTRSSPPYPANKCCGKTMTGNDGAKYTSVQKTSGICAWKKV
jgi:hypothetical protein